MTHLTALTLAAAFAGASALGWALAEPATISGAAYAVDGDTIRVGSVRLRLFGVDAPESTQTCRDAQRRPYACGEAATAALRYMLARDPNVTCAPRDTDRYGRTVAVCRNGEGDLGARMVATGHALDYARYSHGAYRDQQEAAKAERLGVWSGDFVPPEQYRRESRR